MGVVDNIRSFIFGPSERTDRPLQFSDWINYFNYANNTYTYQLNQTMVGNREEIAANFSGLIAGAFKSNGVVFACMLARQVLFSEARFQFQQMRGGRPGDLFGTGDLSVLERPWPGGTTSDLLSRAIQDADLAGTAFLVRTRRDRIRRLRPDWVTMLIGSPFPDAEPEDDADDIDAELLGILYHPGGPGKGRDPERIPVENVAVFAPIPDPAAKFRGMSWLMPIIRDIEGDTAASNHKLNYFDKGATVNLVVQTGVSDPTKFQEWVRAFRREHTGGDSSRTLFVSPGADAKAIGSTLQEADFRNVSASSETRIAAASLLHPTIIGLSEGLQGSSLNTGNFEAAARLTANKFLRPTWRNFSGSLENIVPAPAGSRLWYDDRDVPFLAEDIEKAAKVHQTHATTIDTLLKAGFKADAVLDAVTAGDFERLRGAHTGYLSVQLQPPLAADAVDPVHNGQGSEEDANAVVSQEG
jgi:hypothetical protein